MSVLYKLAGLAILAGIVAYWYFVVGGFFQDTFNTTTTGHVVIYAIAFFVTMIIGAFVTVLGGLFGLLLIFED